MGKKWLGYFKNNLEFNFFSALALLIVFVFGFWWFNPSHIPNNFTGWASAFDIILFGLVSFVIWHQLIMEVLTWCISSNIRDLRRQKPVPGLRVAFITTIVPKNEPIELLHKCLPAMVKANYKHNTWILDEGNSDEVKKICAQYGVFHFSRQGINCFNTQTGKYTKTKGGNHNSWYDTYGDLYDYVAQIDTDFIPKKDFLTKTLGYFKDPKVAFVGTPQIYGNTSQSIVALGAAQQQYSFYGAVLRGLSGMGMTLLIGANHVIRVAAFKKTNHYTAHLTEDLITGMKLHANGWKSVYVPFALAVGEGPSTWSSYFNQQLRWAYGCIDILFNHSGKYFRKMGFKQTLYYFFLQQHYFSGLAMAVSILLLSLYFLFGVRAADIDVFKFFITYSVVILVCWLMSIWLQRFDIHRKNEGQLFLAGKIISVAAWPVWFLAFCSLLSGNRLSYKVTPKGEEGNIRKISFGDFIPHLIFAGTAAAGIIVSVFTKQQSLAMLFWAFSTGWIMLSLPLLGLFTGIYIKFKFWTKKFLNLFNDRRSGESQAAVSQNSGLLVDSLFLIFAVIFSISSYINKIGFYSDDWSFIGNFTLSQDKSLLGLIKTATTPNTFMRPLQNIYDAVLFWVFGTGPLGYHLVNSAVLVLIILMLYLVLRLLKVPRIISLSASLVFAMMPNYSTDRFWYAAYQVNISLLLFLLSTYFGLKAFAGKNAKKILWKTISLGSLILSTLSYEVVLPYVFLNMVLFSGSTAGVNQRSGKKVLHQKRTVFILLNFIILLYIVIFKAKTTTRLGGTFNYPMDIINLAVSIFNTHFFELGLKQPLIWWGIITNNLDKGVFVTALILFFYIFTYFLMLFFSRPVNLPGNTFLRNSVIAGLSVVFLGYAIFFTNNQVGFSPTGIDNRVAIAASIGIAFIFVTFFAWASRTLLGQTSAKVIYSLSISVTCAGGFLVINALASYWGTAYAQSQSALSEIRQNFPSPEKNSIIILDGVCPYSGPAPVFESEWDLKGALQAIYRDPTIRADIVTPRLKVKTEGIETQIYTFKALYEYKNLFIYNFKTKSVYPISSADEANSYFQKYNSDFNNGCPPARAGNGVSVF